MKTLDPIIFNIRKEFILNHARHLFATKGYAETSMDDIAQACSMQKASLYHYFTSKQQLMKELVDWGCARWAERLKDYESGKTLADTLHLIASTILKDLDNPAQQEFFRIVHFESYKNPAIFKALKESPTHNRKGFFAVFAKHLEGKLPSNRIAAFITQFMGAILHFATLTKVQSENLCFEKIEDQDYIDQLVKTFANGVHMLIDRTVG